MVIDMKSLLIDIGSTFIKYGVLDERTGDMLISGLTAFPQAKVNDGKNFLVSVEKTKAKILEIFSELKAYGYKKAFFSVQMHGYIIKNPDNSFSDYVSWRDISGNVTDSRVKNIRLDLMGTSLKNNLPLVKLAFSNCEGEFYTLGSYIAWILTGNNATHISDACASGFYYADTGKYNEYTGKLTMPDVHKSIDPTGFYNDVCIYTPIGDHQISFLGSEAKEEKFLVNIGTATQISCVESDNGRKGEYEKRPYFDNRILYTISGLTGGDKLYCGEGKEKLYEEILGAINKLPPKKEILLGGGGARHVYDYLSKKMAEKNLMCRLIPENIGMKGLKMIAKEKKIQTGCMLSEIKFSNFPIIAKNNGLDFIIIDDEHGYFDYSDISELIIHASLINLNTIVRIGECSRGHITKLADMGVKGFLLPMTNCKEDIQEVVKYAKYPPLGKRGISTTRVHTMYNPPPLKDCMESANEAMKIYAQIETSRGIENIDEILAVDGVTGIFIGPNDLSVDLNCVSDKKTLLGYLNKIISAAQKAVKPFGIITVSKELIDFAVQNDVAMISVGSELNMLINGCKKIKEEF